MLLVSNHARVMYCKLLDKNRVEICQGVAVDMDAEPTLDMREVFGKFGVFDEFDKRVKMELVNAYRNRLAGLNPIYAKMTKQQAICIMNSMIRIGEYKMDWGFCGWS